MSKSLSIIVPCYNEEKMVELFYQETMQYVQALDRPYELIFVNDGSKDQTLIKLYQLRNLNPNIAILNFSRNFGKEAAMFAGLEYASGDYVVIMDCDLQHPPYLLKAMIDAIESERYDMVAAYRTNKRGNEPFLRRLYSRLFYSFMNRTGDVKLTSGATDYRMMTRPVVDSLLRLKESNRFSKGLFAWVGFKTKYLPYANVERREGKSSWNFFKLLNYAIQGITSFSTVPLRLSSYLGLISATGSFVYMMFVIIRKLIEPTSAVDGFATIISVVLFLGGIILISLGVLGEYIGRIYNEVKQRPLYILSQKEDSFLKQVRERDL